MYNTLFFVFFLHQQSSLGMENFKEACNTETLADKKVRATLKRHFLWTPMNVREIAKRKNISIENVTSKHIEEYIGGMLGPIKREPTQEDYIDLCLGGKLYKAIDRAGSGDEGDVYKIMNSEGKTFALKVYDDDFSKSYQKGDLLAMQKSRKSREFLNIPLIVNTQYKYSLFPLLNLPYELKQNIQNFHEFENKLDAALKEDGLLIGDTDNKQNYMYDENDRLWRIDLSTLEELK